MQVSDAKHVLTASPLCRFGVAFMNEGSLVMGFDAPPGTGDDRNRERINLVADEKGGAHIRFLDRRTSVVSRMYLDEQNRGWFRTHRRGGRSAPAMTRRVQRPILDRGMA
jgi:hypothetical protein